MTTSTRPFYERFGWAYDLLVPDPIEPWIDAVTEVLGSHGLTTPTRILDAGCGTGRHAEALTRLGHVVALVDASSTLLAVAKKRAPELEATQADLRCLDLGQRFDAVLCRGVLNDLLTDDDRDGAVRGLANHLDRGGLLILDARDADASVDRYSEPTTHRKILRTCAGDLVFSSRVEASDGLLVCDERHEWRQPKGVVVAEHRFLMRPWTPDELRTRLRRASLDLSDIEPAPESRRGDRRLVTARPLDRRLL